MRIAGAISLTMLLTISLSSIADETDPYLWLEDVRGAKSLQWVAMENARTREKIMGDPRYEEDYGTALRILDAPDRIVSNEFLGGAVFGLWQDARHPKGIWRRTSIASYKASSPKWQTLLDIDKLAADEKTNWVFKSSVCTASLERCLISLSKGGSDAIVVREFDLDSRSFLTNGFMLPEAKSDAAYVDDNTVLFDSDFGAGSLTAAGLPRIVKVWKRGRPVSEAKTVFEGRATDVASSTMIVRKPEGTTAIISRQITYSSTEYYALRPNGTAAKLELPLSTTVYDLVRGQLILTLGDDWRAYGQTFRKGALLAIAYAPLLSHGVPAIHVLYAPGPRESIDSVQAGDGIVYASIYSNVAGTIHAYRLVGGMTWDEKIVATPANGATTLVSTNDFGSDVLFTFESFLIPQTLYFYDAVHPPVPLQSVPARFDAAKFVTEQFEARSTDGVEIPYFVVHAKKLSGSAPTLLRGYGGFGLSLKPGYSGPLGVLWLDRGGVYVSANIRGGGEFGPSWHMAAIQQNRQKAFDDFTAVASDLERRGLTTPKQLGILGDSNGGLLVATVMTQRPQLFGAVVCQVPLLDMMRYTKLGAGAQWTDEYGNPDDPKARAWLLKYSPYQNTSPNKNYPPILFLTATNDDRVTPVHARKMVAKMRAQGHDVLFYEDTAGGHSIDADHKQVAEMGALSLIFLKRELGMK